MRKRNITMQEIASKRRYLNVNQSELAEALEISRATYVSYEKETTEISLNNANKAMKFLNLVEKSLND